MALYHRAKITPTKAEIIAAWAPTRPWGPAPDDPVEMVGSYRIDDPDGRVGIETHLVTAGGALFQVPLTYRDEPLDGAEDALITQPRAPAPHRPHGHLGRAARSGRPRRGPGTLKAVAELLATIAWGAGRGCRPGRRPGTSGRWSPEAMGSARPLLRQ